MAIESISKEEAKKIGDDIKDYIEKRLEGCKIIYTVSYCAPKENSEGKKLFNTAFFNMKDNDTFADVSNIIASFGYTVQHIMEKFKPKFAKAEDINQDDQKQNKFGGAYG